MTQPHRTPATIEVGDHFNEWTVVALEPRGTGRVVARCSCGSEHRVDRENMVYGLSKRCVACGYRSSGEKQRVTGSSGPAYNFWSHRRGRRCRRWRVSARFLSDMGAAPSPEHRLSTPDTAICCGACAECLGAKHERNVVWALPELRRAHRALVSAQLSVVIDGERMTVSAAARRNGMSQQGVWRRIDAGWPILAACTVPKGAPLPRRVEVA